MAANDLVEFLRRETDELAQEYERIQRRVKEDPGTAGDQTEENWASILRQWLPAYYPIVTKGRILGRDGTASPQVDVLVLSPAYPQKLRDKKLYLAGGVIAAFECKTTLRVAHLRTFFETCRAVRALSPAPVGTPARELRPRILYGLLAHSHEWKADAAKPAENIARNIAELDAELVKRPADMPDLFCVADVGFWHALKALIPVPSQPGRFSMATAGSLELMTSYIAHLHDTQNQSPTFTPIGALLTILFGKLAWSDAEMRGLEDYFRAANVSGGGMGSNRAWPLDVLSEELRRTLHPERLTSGVMFNEWSAGPF